MKTNLPSFEHFTRCVWTILAMLFLHRRALTRENLSWGFPTKQGATQLAELHCMCGSRNKLEGRIEKSVPRIAVWHHEACWLMTNGDPEGLIFLSYPHTSNGFFFLLTTVFYLFMYFEIRSQRSLNASRCNFTGWRYFTSWVKKNMGKIRFFHHRVKSQISLSGVKEKKHQHVCVCVFPFFSFFGRGVLTF